MKKINIVMHITSDMEKQEQLESIHESTYIKGANKILSNSNLDEDKKNRIIDNILNR